MRKWCFRQWLIFLCHNSWCFLYNHPLRHQLYFQMVYQVWIWMLQFCHLLCFRQLIFSVWSSKYVSILGRCFSFSITSDEDFFVGFFCALIPSERRIVHGGRFANFFEIFFNSILCFSNIWTDWVKMVCFFSNILSDRVNMYCIVLPGLFFDTSDGGGVEIVVDSVDGVMFSLEPYPVIMEKGIIIHIVLLGL